MSQKKIYFHSKLRGLNLEHFSIKVFFSSLAKVRTKSLCAGQAGINPAATLSINPVNLSEVEAHAQSLESGYMNLGSVLFLLGLSI